MEPSPGTIELTTGATEQSPTVENIVVPPHLLATVNDREEWSPEPQRLRGTSPQREDSRRTFDIQRIAAEQAHELEDANNVPVDVLPARSAPRDYFAQRPRAQTLDYIRRSEDRTRVTPVGFFGGRKTSLLVPLRGSPSGLTSHQQPEQQKPPVHRRSSSETYRLQKQRSSPFEGVPEATDEKLTVPVEDIPEGTVLFKKLSRFNLQGGNSSRMKNLTEGETQDGSESDPHTPSRYFVSLDEPSVAPRGSSAEQEVHPGSGRATVERGRNSRRSTARAVAETVSDAVQTATHTIAQTTRRTTLANIYEMAKVRKVELEREKWVRVLFEVSIYLLLLCFIYFVLVGRPLWNGAVWWLFWVVENRFVIQGTWSITIGLAVL